MPPATPHSTACASAAGAVASTTNDRSNSNQLNPNNRIEPKNSNNNRGTDIPDPNSAMKIQGWEEDQILSRSKYLHKMEVLKRRHRRTKQLQRIYRDAYWALMEEVKLKHREYCWKFGISAFQQDNDSKAAADTLATAENNGNGNSCEILGCKAKPMALTRFCYIHILNDSKQKLYKPCNFAIKCSPTGPILCEKPILRSTVPSYCSLHFQKAEKHVTRALKKAGLNVSNTSKLAPKFHVIVAEYVSQIQKRRRAAQKAALQNAGEVKEENSS